MAAGGLDGAGGLLPRHRLKRLPGQIDPARGLNTYNFAEQDGSWAGELPGISVFLRPEQASEDVFHTYSSYARGGDQLLAMDTYLDLTPLGRQEDWEQPPGRSDGPFMSWVRRHDEY